MLKAHVILIKRYRRNFINRLAPATRPLETRDTLSLPNVGQISSAGHYMPLVRLSNNCHLRGPIKVAEIGTCTSTWLFILLHIC